MQNLTISDSEKIFLKGNPPNKKIIIDSDLLFIALDLTNQIFMASRGRSLSPTVERLLLAISKARTENKI
jgi:hypothetical protein